MLLYYFINEFIKAFVYMFIKERTKTKQRYNSYHKKVYQKTETI